MSTGQMEPWVDMKKLESMYGVRDSVRSKGIGLLNAKRCEI